MMVCDWCDGPRSSRKRASREARARTRRVAQCFPCKRQAIAVSLGEAYSRGLVGAWEASGCLNGRQRDCERESGREAKAVREPLTTVALVNSTVTPS